MPAGDRLAVKRVFCAVDPGLVVNPNTLAAQIEGGIGFALTTALKSRITFADGGAEQTNFLDYPLLSIDEMPEIVAIVLPTDRPPQGFVAGVTGPEAAAVQRAWIARDVPQCGYCQSGQIISAIALLKAIRKPSDRDIDLAMNGNLCRCATYVRICAAIHDAARELGG